MDLEREDATVLPYPALPEGAGISSSIAASGYPGKETVEIRRTGKPSSGCALRCVRARLYTTVQRGVEDASSLQNAEAPTCGLALADSSRRVPRGVQQVCDSRVPAEDEPTLDTLAPADRVSRPWQSALVIGWSRSKENDSYKHPLKLRLQAEIRHANLHRVKQTAVQASCSFSGGGSGGGRLERWSPFPKLLQCENKRLRAACCMG